MEYSKTKPYYSIAEGLLRYFADNDVKSNCKGIPASRAAY
ncbi:MAG: hypothetical protein H6Q14_2916 [Bacteroidetes bacterium]|jgi:hypothetical protein|nr:hypothetical protein [Bacteroidota bacterium]